MLPYISLLGKPFGTNSLLMLGCLLLALGTAFFSFSGVHREPWWKHFVFVFSLAFVTLLGARLFHVFFERPSLWQTPSLIFARYDGMTFYGGMALALPLCWIFSYRLYRVENCAKVMDLSALGGALFYAILRLGCLAGGCCWGSVCIHPWAIRYSDPRSVMPHLGLPVHPVQIYESLLNFLFFAFLYHLYRQKKSVGKLTTIFLGIHAVGRFVTEFFRGDKIRGENIFWGFSTSQIISLAILVILAIGYIRLNLKMKKGKSI